MPSGTYAIVRGVATTYGRCIRPAGSRDDIDVNLARKQHAAYCETLGQLGLTLIEIEPDDRFPDSCFVEDTAIVVGAKAIITRMAAGSRLGEEVEVKKHLQVLREIHEIESPGTIDGGDVLIIDDKIYIGMGERTNESAVRQASRILAPSEYQVIPVALRGILHLKSACTYVGDDHLLMLPGHFDETIFSEYRVIIVPDHEAYAANCLSVNGKVLISRGYPETKHLIEGRRFETVDLEMSEFRKGQGSLTCLSKIF
jgi:dimethylargininase